MKLVKVQWRDITTYSDRVPLEKALSLTTTPTTTAGLLLQEDKDDIRVVHSFWEHEGLVMYGDVTVIPKGCTVDIWREK